MECNRRQTQKLLSGFWTELLQLSRTEETLMFAHSYRRLSITPGDLCCATPSPAASVFHRFCLSLLFWGPEAVVWVRCSGKHTVLRARGDHVGSFSASSGGHTGWGSRQEGWISSWSHVSLWLFVRRAVGPLAGFPSRRGWVRSSHLVGREGCPHTPWQSGGRTPKRRWSSWDGCSGLQKNFSGVAPKNDNKWRRLRSFFFTRTFIWQFIAKDKDLQRHFSFRIHLLPPVLAHNC